MERKINKVIIHCSNTPESMDIGVDKIREWHIKGNGWKDVGYHYIIRKDGKIELGRGLNEIGSHTKGYNKESIGVCYIGGWEDNDDRTDAQKKTLLELIKKLKKNFKDITIHGHNEFSNKSCPNFNVQEEYEEFI